MFTFQVTVCQERSILINIAEFYERVASGAREEALTLGIEGHDEQVLPRVFALEIVAAARGDLQMVVNDPMNR